MDTSDPTVIIDESGQCNYCTEFDEIWLPRWHPDAIGEARLEEELERLRNSTKNNLYQVVLGISGGIDSSYLALKAKEWDLRVLAVHVDAGWDTPEALDNIRLLLAHCNFDYRVITPNWETIRKLQLAFLRSGIANQDIPQDHAFFTALYNIAQINGITHVLSGFNVASEAVSSRAWEESGIDSWLVRDVARKTGLHQLDGYPLTGLFEYYITNPIVRKMKVLSPLNFMPYSTSRALNELVTTLEFRDYGPKHSESYFTRFYQGRYMPERFGIDSRNANLSNRINSGEIDRQSALNTLSTPAYEADLLEADTAIVAEKLQISVDELEAYIQMPPGYTRRFASQASIRRALKRLQTQFEKVSSRRVGRYM